MPDFGKDWRPTRSPEASANFAERVYELRSELRLRDPRLVAERSGTHYRAQSSGRGELRVPFWENVCTLPWPELTGSDHLAKPLTDFQLAFLFHHLLTADGIPLSGQWVSFADLPNGRMYNTAFQGYSGDEVVKFIGLELEVFRQACISTGGTETNLASAAFVFQALPRVPLMITYWLGDEDFPSTCKILFDASAVHYLPIDGCAIVGSMLVRKLIHS
jgi:hypothetical protein